MLTQTEARALAKMANEAIEKAFASNPSMFYSCLLEETTVYQVSFVQPALRFTLGHVSIDVRLDTLGNQFDDDRKEIIERAILEALKGKDFWFAVNFI